MDAPLTVTRPEKPSTNAPSAAHVDSSFPRLVSVSPRAAASQAIATPGMRRRTDHLLTSRPEIDLPAFDELAETLRSLVDDAVKASRKLAAQISHAEATRQGARETTGSLQDRLCLGARMLTAFQSQIVRIEEALEYMEARAAKAELSAGGD